MGRGKIPILPGAKQGRSSAFPLTYTIIPLFQMSAAYLSNALKELDPRPHPKLLPLQVNILIKIFSYFII